MVEEWSEAGIFLTHYETNLDSTIYWIRRGGVSRVNTTLLLMGSGNCSTASSLP
jgi:hypothetical protein